MLKMVLAAASACCLAAGMLLLSGGVMVNRVQATTCRLQNSRLDLQFDPEAVKAIAKKAFIGIYPAAKIKIPRTRKKKYIKLLAKKYG
mgnify:CR=1 FL=1